MKNNVATKWIKALRSNKYHQGKDYLKKVSKGKTKHCCLGVLCELYNAEMKKNKKKTLKEKNLDFYVQFNGDATILPTVVKKWAGLKSLEGALPRKYYINKDGTVHNPFDLAGANDEGKKFKTIANIIQKYWKEL